MSNFYLFLWKFHRQQLYYPRNWSSVGVNLLAVNFPTYSFGKKMPRFKVYTKYLIVEYLIFSSFLCVVAARGLSVMIAGLFRCQTTINVKPQVLKTYPRKKKPPKKPYQDLIKGIIQSPFNVTSTYLSYIHIIL